MQSFARQSSLVFAFVMFASVAQAAPITAEAYRDLIVSTADPLSDISAYGDVASGSGKCIMNFTRTDAAMQQAAARVKTWEGTKPPEAFVKSHADIMAWMKTALEKVKAIGTCIEPVMQQPEEQFYFFAHLGSFEDLRKEAATALGALNIELPPRQKK